METSLTSTQTCVQQLRQQLAKREEEMAKMECQYKLYLEKAKQVSREHGYGCCHSCCHSHSCCHQHCTDRIHPSLHTTGQGQILPSSSYAIYSDSCLRGSNNIDYMLNQWPHNKSSAIVMHAQTASVFNGSPSTNMFNKSDMNIQTSAACTTSLTEPQIAKPRMTEAKMHDASTQVVQSVSTQTNSIRNSHRIGAKHHHSNNSLRKSTALDGCCSSGRHQEEPYFRSRAYNSPTSGGASLSSNTNVKKAIQSNPSTPSKSKNSTPSKSKNSTPKKIHPQRSASTGRLPQRDRFRYNPTPVIPPASDNESVSSDSSSESLKPSFLSILVGLYFQQNMED